MPASRGLRERKKAQTRAAIQHHALRLFRDAGWDATTIEQIATAAEVSPSTLYRYFPCKEALVLADDYDPLLAAAFRTQPASMTVVEAYRAALLEVLSDVGADEGGELLDRFQLALAIPEVRAKTLDHLLQTSDTLAELFTERTGRPAGDFEMQVLAGTTLGAVMAAQVRWSRDPAQDLFGLLGAALDLVRARTAH